MELECLEGRIHGARYYTVKPNFDLWGTEGIYHARITWQDMTEWCIDTFGQVAEMGVWVEGCTWYANNGKFWFRNEADRALFVLKWQ